MEQILFAEQLRCGDILLPGGEIVLAVEDTVEENRLVLVFRPATGRGRKSVWQVHAKHKFCVSTPEEQR